LRAETEQTFIPVGLNKSKNMSLFTTRYHTTKQGRLIITFWRHGALKGSRGGTQGAGNTWVETA